MAAQPNEKDVAGVLYLINKGGSNGFPFRIRLQKLLLLGKLEFKFPFSFKYESHYYGPYSSDLQAMVSELATADFLDEVNVEFEDGRYAFVYSITRKGEAALRSAPLTKEDKKALDMLWEKYRTWSTDDIVKAAKEKSGIKSKYE